MLIHVFSPYVPPDGPTNRRYAVAAMTWARLYQQTGWRVLPVPDQCPSGQDSTAIGDPSRIPLVRGLFDRAAQQAAARGAMGFFYTNLDACLMSDTIDRVTSGLLTDGCCYSLRYDHRGMMDVLSDQAASRGKRYPGADLFAWTPAKWRRVRERFPDVYLAGEGWDWVMKQLMHECGFDPKAAGDPVVYHEEHPADWKCNRKSVLQQHNHRACLNWAKANGYQKHLLPGAEKGGYLFR